MQSPWDITPELTLDRILVLRDGIFRARSFTAKMFGPELRNLGFGYGCTAAQKSMHEIMEISQEQSWLIVKNQGQRYSAFVGGSMVKFFRGDDEPDWGRFQRVDREMAALRDNSELSFGENSGWFWFFRVSVNVKGDVTEIAMLRCHTKGEVSYAWDIPLDDTVVPMKQPPVKQGRAQLKLVEFSKEQSDDNKDD